MSKVATISKALKELRIHFCQTSPGSQGIREYISASYPALKQQNPKLPILIREARGVEARVFGRYDKGAETKVLLENLNQNEVAAKIEQVLKQ